MRNPNVYPVDVTTGEVVPGITMYDERDRELAKERKKRETKVLVRKYDHRDLSAGGFFLSGCKKNQFAGLEPQDIARLVYLASFMDFHSVLYDAKRETKLGVADLPELLGVSKMTFYDLWNKIKNVYIFEGKDGSLTVHGNFFIGKQKRIDERLTKIFTQKVRALYRNTPTKQHVYLGYVFQLLYCVNIQYNIICSNPLETTLDDIDPLTVKEFCALIGYDEGQSSRIEKVYRKIMFPCGNHKEYFCAFVHLGCNNGDTRIVINPRIFYAGNRHEEVQALGLFFKPKKPRKTPDSF